MGLVFAGLDAPRFGCADRVRDRLYVDFAVRSRVLEPIDICLLDWTGSNRRFQNLRNQYFAFIV